MVSSTVIGLDLCGPVRSENTGVAVFTPAGAELIFKELACDGSDSSIWDTVARLAASGDVLVGIDAPLSYEAAGGFRRRDRSLRQALEQHGSHSNKVMPPLAPQMVYLTLRGLAVARMLCSLPIKVVEVHPTASFALRNGLGDPRNAMDPRNLEELEAWFKSQGISGIDLKSGCTAHFIAACLAALAAWKWSKSDWMWRAEAEPPFHPFDFVC